MVGNKKLIDSERPIFITGAPRCGSSWVGEILGRTDGTRYVYEPFNLNWAPELKGRLSYFRYLKPSSAVAPEIVAAAQKAFSGQQGRKQLLRAAFRGYFSATVGSHRRVLVKDPTAPLMTSWLVEQFDVIPVVIVRHPCGFASSIGALDWKVSVEHFLRQPHLMADHLGPYVDVLERCASDTWLTRGAVWACIHHVLFAQARKNSDWRIYRYEDLCNSPKQQFLQIAKDLDLPFGASDYTRIARKSSRASDDAGSTSKLSAAMPELWERRLSPGQIDAVVGIVQEFGLQLYSVKSTH